MAIKKKFWYSGDQIELNGSLGAESGGNNNNNESGSNPEPLQLKTVGGISLIGDGDIPLPSVQGLESQSNRVNTISANSTNATDPTAKAVYEYVDDIVGDINAALETIMGGGA